MSDRFFIAPYDANSGLQNDVRPWLIPDEAWATLNNAYVWRGRVKKRFGSQLFKNSPLLSRLRVRIGTTDGAGDYSGEVPTDSLGNPIATPAIGQMFSIGQNLFTANVDASPANLLRTDGQADVATYDFTTGAVEIENSDALTAVYFYPALPVMGLLTYETPTISNERIIGFDTRFAYEYVNGWERLDQELTPNAAFWTGSDSQFFWGETYSGADAFEKIFFVTNFDENDPNGIRVLVNDVWQSYRPGLSSVPDPDKPYLNNCLILIAYKNRLLAFNTWEGTTSPGDNYQNRVRWSAIGSPLAINAWYQNVAGLGGALDAPTSEAIITVEFVKDQLVVFFERSTWALVYTQNQALPFAWQKINTELGAESTFSIVPFDKVAIGVGNVGIVACNGANVERIDEKIPNEVFDIHNDDGGVQRVYGVRDYYTEMIYWTFPDTDASSDFPFPRRVLTYNYKNATWAFNDDSITCFGYYQISETTSGISWDSTEITWDDSVIWGSGPIQPRFRAVVGGNQEGFTFIVDSTVTTNAQALQITDIQYVNNLVTITAVNHNLREGDYVFLQDIIGDGGNIETLNNTIFLVISSSDNPITSDVFSLNAASYTGAYLGGGLIRRVSQLNLTSKQYNFYAKQGRNAYVSKIDFMVTKTGFGQLDVNYYVSTNVTNLLAASNISGSLLGTGALNTFAYPTVPFEATASRVWHPVYLQADGEVIQIQLTMNDNQMRSTDIMKSDFELHAMCVYATPTSSRFQ